MFPVPQNFICSPVPLIFRPLFPCSPEINSPVPQNPSKGLIDKMYFPLFWAFLMIDFQRRSSEVVSVKDSKIVYVKVYTTCSNEY